MVLPRRLGKNIWSSDEGLAALLGLLATQVFVVVPLAAQGWLGGFALVAGDVWLSLVTLSGAVALGWRKRSTWALMGLLVASFFVRWADRWIPFLGRVAIDSFVSIAIESVLIAMILHQVFRAGVVTKHRILGAVAAYLLIGVVCAEMYHLLDTFEAGALSNINGVFGVERNAQILYFSFTTLTTTGYGDIAPVNIGARAVANLEGFVGQLFPAILIARLVSQQTASLTPPPVPSRTASPANMTADATDVGDRALCGESK